MRIVERPSPNHNERPGGRAPDMLVLHYTGMVSAAAALDRLCDPAAQVSAHYTVDEDGTVYAHVAEDRRAWHAGVAWWQGETDVNGLSIGIEIVNPGHEFGYRAFPELQMQAVLALSKAIVERYGIRPLGVVGHSDVAPERKTDPGELFDWQMLAAAGVGYWPDARTVRTRLGADTEGDLQSIGRNLARIGYRWPAEPGSAGAAPARGQAAVLAAFQRHFRPASVTGDVDPETAALAAIVAAAA